MTMKFVSEALSSLVFFAVLVGSSTQIKYCICNQKNENSIDLVVPIHLIYQRPEYQKSPF